MKYIGLIFLLSLVKISHGLVPDQITIVILSQPNSYHSHRANLLRDNLINQSLNITGATAQQNQPQILLTHLEFPKKIGSWAITPILRDLKSRIHKFTEWIVICDDRCRINLKLLLECLELETGDFLGYPLYDRSATIIHHFAYHENPTEFFYPQLSAGIILSRDLLGRIVIQPGLAIDFTIDVQHELAQFLYERLDLKLTSVPYLCSSTITNHLDYVKCAIQDDDDDAAIMGNKCNVIESTGIREIYFGVKTCEKFHETRIPVVKRTWGKFVPNIRYFSDVSDVDIPTVYVGVKNTETGHCEKTFKMLEYMVRESKGMKEIKWLVIADDDTLISPYRLMKYLDCFHQEKDVALGERYGFHVMNNKGYNYITGGGGIVFKISTAKKILNNCKCPQIDSPDDMILGLCLKRLGIEIIHSHLFHQARSIDYAPEMLDRRRTISFHKFWMCDPDLVYGEWFEEDDLNLSHQNDAGDSLNDGSMEYCDKNEIKDEL